jgi:hypothetical protein
MANGFPAPIAAVIPERASSRNPQNQVYDVIDT